MCHCVCLIYNNANNVFSSFYFFSFFLFPILSFLSFLLFLLQNPFKDTVIDCSPEDSTFVNMDFEEGQEATEEYEPTTRVEMVSASNYNM